MKFELIKSMELHKKALNFMPGGVSSNARLWQNICDVYCPCTIFVKKAFGSHLWDVDGNEYIDYRMAFGPVILGHSNIHVRKRIHQNLKNGTIHAFDSEMEIKVAEKINSFFPSIEMLRFSVSGTEATMHALRIARAYTGKKKIVKFEGHYHGGHDYLLFSTTSSLSDLPIKPKPSSLGIPEEISKLIFVNEWNDFEGIEKTVKNHHNEIAAIITEPIMGNAAAIQPKKDYLQFLKELCDKYNIILIFDEVKTGFRVSDGGAQKLFGVKPHLTTLAKAMGNGYPVSVIGGSKEIMQIIGKNKVFHGGTYAGHPISLTAVDATLSEIRKGYVHKKIDIFGKKLMTGIKDIFQDNKINGIIQGQPGMFQFMFTDKEQISTFRTFLNCDLEFYSKLQNLLLKKGIMVDETNAEPIFTSSAHTKDDLSKTLESLDSVISLVKKSKIKKSKNRF